MADILGMMDYIGRRTDQGVQTGKQNRLAGLYQQALQAPRDQRSGLIAQMAGVSPQAAFDAEKHFGGMDDTARQRLGQYAAAFDALPDDQKPQAYPQLAAQAQELGIPAPSQWDPAYATNIQRLAQTLGAGSAGGTVQSRFVDQQGNVMVVMRDGTVRPLGVQAENRLQMRDQPGVPLGAFDPRAGTIRGVQEAGAQQPQQQMAPGEVPFSIDPNLPPAVQAAIRANPQQFASMGDGQSVTVPGVMPSQSGVAASRPSEAQAAFNQQSAKNAADIAAARDMTRIAADREAAVTRAREQAEAQAQKMSALPQTIASADETIALLDRVLNHPGRTAATGISSMNPINKIPGTSAFDFNVMLDQIKGQSFLQAFQSLKGGGAITEREGQAATNAIARLNAAQSEGEFVTAINDLKRIVQQGRDRAIQGATGSGEQAAPAQQQGRASLPPGFSWED